MLSYPDFMFKNIIMVFSEEGHKLSIKNDNLFVKDEEDKVVLQNTCYRMLAVWLIGNCIVTSGLLERSKKFGFPVYLLSHNLRQIGCWNAPTEGNFLLRQRQYEYVGNEISVYLIKNKIGNQIETLKTLRDKNDACKNAIEKLQEYRERLTFDLPRDEILGLEGIASKVYFSIWFQEQNWNARRPRTKFDIINVLLDIGYTFLFYLVENMLGLYGFDLYKGVYHQAFYQRKSLVCDLVEPFRCIVDRQIRKAYNLGQIKADDFNKKGQQFILKTSKNKEYSGWMMKGLLEYKADIFLYCQNYYRFFIRKKSATEFPYFNVLEPYKG